MSEFTDTNSALSTLLKAVSGIGTVYDRFRYVTTQDELNELFLQSDGSYYGAMYRRTSIGEAVDEIDEADITFTLLVVRAINEENNSEHAAQETVDSIIDKLKDSLINGYEVKSISMQNFQDAEYGPILIHQAILQLVLTVNN